MAAFALHTYNGGENVQWQMQLYHMNFRKSQATSMAFSFFVLLES